MQATIKMDCTDFLYKSYSLGCQGKRQGKDILKLKTHNSSIISNVKGHWCSAVLYVFAVFLNLVKKLFNLPSKGSNFTSLGEILHLKNIRKWMEILLLYYLQFIVIVTLYYFCHLLPLYYCAGMSVLNVCTLPCQDLLRKIFKKFFLQNFFILIKFSLGQVVQLYFCACLELVFSQSPERI